MNTTPTVYPNHAVALPIPRPRPPSDDLTLTALHNTIRFCGLFASPCQPDMQLGVSLDDIIDRTIPGAVDVLGVSITFGQHDLTIERCSGGWAAVFLDPVPTPRSGQ
jgi:hypothetical protein